MHRSCLLLRRLAGLVGNDRAGVTAGGDLTAVNFANSDEKIDLAQAGFPAGAIAKFEGVVPSAWRLTEHLEMTEVAQPLPLFFSPVNKKAPAC